MKCDELQYERLGDVNKTYPASTLVIRKQFVDAAIAELKAENESALKAVSHWHDNYCELQKVVDRLQTKSECKEDKIRILKRALWMARADRAKEKQNHFALCHNHSINIYLCINGSSRPTERNTTMRLSSEWSMIWKKVVSKCRAKAEEYK